MSRWGIDGPPPEAYSRITNPERFQPLHGAALGLIEMLESTFEVERAEGYGIDPELEGRVGELAQPSVRLTPRSQDAAPLVFVFSPFPGVHVRAGRWYFEPFPGCGCDACDETADSEVEGLTRLVDNVTSGRISETVLLYPTGHGIYERAGWSSSGGSRHQSRISPAEARQMLAGGERSSYLWMPWPLRDAPA